MSDTLRITVAEGIQDINVFRGLPCNMVFVLNSNVEINIGCPVGWTMDEFPGILSKACTEKPVTLHLISAKFCDSILN
jgi:hypothetical protein